MCKLVRNVHLFSLFGVLLTMLAAAHARAQQQPAAPNWPPYPPVLPEAMTNAPGDMRTNTYGNIDVPSGSTPPSTGSPYTAASQYPPTHYNPASPYMPASQDAQAGTPVIPYSPGTSPPSSYPPGSYPPASYPPGSYPPGSYPPGSYPPASYPPATAALPPAAESIPPGETIWSEPPPAGPIVVPPLSSDSIIPEPEPPPKIWTASFELGINGSQGNSETRNLWVGADLKRNIDWSLLTLAVDYRKESASGVDTVNRLLAEARHEWLLGDSPWSVYLHGTLAFDDFQAFDSRVAADAGFGYNFINNDVTLFRGRAGAGFSREIGGPDDSYVPEAVFGLDYERQLTSRQRLEASVDYYPSWEDFMDYRLVAKADWLLKIDDEANLSLKFGVVDRYDSTPNGARPNDLDYTAVLLWSF